VLAVLVAGFAAFASSVAATAWTPPPAAQRVLVGGMPYSEVAPGPDGAAQIHAAIDIAAPPKVVWSVMNDCRYFKRLIANAVDCRIVQGDAERAGWDVRETVTAPGLFVPTIHNVYRSEYQPYSRIRFRKAGGNLKVEDGEWRLEALNNGAATRVIYENLLNANIFAPAPLVRAGMRKDTAGALAALRQVTLSVWR
jgi:hypothetical protein